MGLIKYTPSKKELKELGFKLDDGDHYNTVVTTNNIYNIVINYFKIKIFFYWGVVNYFIPDSFEDLKVIIRIFGKNVNNYKNKESSK